jgi:hypothetical protein
MTAVGVEALAGQHGTIRVEHDLSLGHYRIRLGPIKLFWKSTPSWEINFINDEENLGYQVIVKEAHITFSG